MSGILAASDTREGLQTIVAYLLQDGSVEILSYGRIARSGKILPSLRWRKINGRTKLWICEGRDPKIWARLPKRRHRPDVFRA